MNESQSTLPPRTRKAVLTHLSDFYVAAGRPLLPLTRWMRWPIRWYYHRSRLIRHDHRRFLKPRLLTRLHTTLIGECPVDFSIYGGKIRFRSAGSVMSLHGYYVGEIEYHLMRYLVSQLHPNMVMLDVGAHHGAFTVVAAYELKKRGWKGVVHSFEPDPRNFAFLEYNVRQNGLQDYVVLHQQAVADLNSLRKLVMYRSENSANALEHADDFSEAAPEALISRQVQTICLDSLLSLVPHVDLIKMDIQGAELWALTGAQSMIERDRPTLLLEATPGRKSTEEMEVFLDRKGYLISGVAADGCLCPVGSPDVFISWDWVALPG
ncbi:MAG: FkbM family methyltransferase [Oscillochloris sp.]|nr:FkbM family methyltransferase [Oscillochloris sp.]